MKNHPRLVSFLSQPESYRDATKTLEIKETHISLIFLTDRHAYKFKKAIALAFLDYSTLEKRHEACLAELNLGRRFAGDVYQQIVAVRELPDGSLSFGDRGKVIEYAVQMQRLSDDLMLHQILARGEASEQQIERLVEHLGLCYRKAPKVPLLPFEYVQRVRRHLDENRQSLVDLAPVLQLDEKPWRSICSRQSLYLETHGQVFEERVRMERIIDGHGDLRPEHVFLGEPIAWIDGVEFSQDLRTLDVADELCFLAMEAAMMGRLGFAQNFLHKSLQALGDKADPELLAFYQSYRAIVRAKVGLIRAVQLKGEAREKELQLAHAYRKFAEELMNPIMAKHVFVIAGPMGSGKTSLARALQNRLGAQHLQTDVIRSQLFGHNPAQDAFGEGRYSKEARGQVYQELKRQMLESIDEGSNVVIDGTFGEPEQLNILLEPLQKAKIPFFLLSCECPDHLAMQRIQARRRAGHSESEARPELYLQQKSRGDWNFTGYPHCRVDTTLSLEHQLHRAFRALHSYERESSIGRKRVG